MKVATSLLLIAGASAQVGRTVVPFGSGWKFMIGDDPKGPGAGPNQCEFSRNVSGLTCTGMETDPNRFTMEDCKTSCCYDENCYVWQQAATQCFHGGKDAKCSSDEPVNTVAGPIKNLNGAMRATAPPFQVDYSYAQQDFDDSNWDTISVPHDFLINGTFTESGDVHHGFLPRLVGWYRKTFTIPKGTATSHLYFEGAHHFKEVYLNGKLHTTHKCGYTPFTVSLDGFNGTVNIAIRVDATYGSGHWYEGGGLYRGVSLILFPTMIRLNEMGGVFVDPASPLDAIRVSSEVVLNDVPIDQKVVVSFTLTELSGKVIGESNVTKTIPKNTPKNTIDNFVSVITPTEAMQLWSPTSPNLYKVVTNLFVNDDGVVDSLSVTSGFRSIKWTTEGMYLNGKNMKLKGFSHHNSFGGSGVMQSARLDLFRLRTGEALGANYFRMSHNPYDENMYSLQSAMGILCWDENRDFGIDYVDDFSTMIRAHRSFPAVSVWSFCNEYECAKFYTGNETGNAFQKTAKTLDPFRNTTANMELGEMSRDPVMADVTGFSHAGNNSFETWHKEHPEKPLILSECCSCQTTRTSNRQAGANCMPQQNSPMELPYVSGSIGVWTLLDYFGESHTWPAVTSQYGQFDVTGFPKPHAWYYRRHWTEQYVQKKVSRIITMLVQNSTEISGVVGSSFAELFIDGSSQGVIAADSTGVVSWKVHQGTLAVKNATLVNLSPSKVPTGDKHTLIQPGDAASLKISVDVPSPTTGTGSKLYLDGTDVALLHVTLLDAEGTAVSQDLNQVNVTWEVVSGPAKVLGVGNGDVKNHQKVLGNTISTYAGLARSVIQITVDCVSASRGLVEAVDSLKGPISYSNSCPQGPVVVKASSESLPSTTVQIEVSGLPQDSPFAAASDRNVDYTYLDDIQS
eukprot:TRINITY_DN884_c0_g1_i1.p1 TRINITY_DN884_c0_g1~~TRINITY_DN884_c0_g1_i1.p1  ORF type:complete len:927 (+),score=254.24 TRINITY_DN884_c0_g1_i1:63-2783(+)